MIAALVFLVWSLQMMDSNLALETPPQEVDILWQKYGELRSELETVKAKRKSDIKKILTLENDVTIIKAILEKPNDILVPRNNETLDPDAISDDMNVVPASPKLKDGHFQLLQASIQSSGSRSTFSLHVIVTDESFTYQWYDDGFVPIFPGDQNFLIYETKIETRYHLTLISRHSKEYLQNNSITVRLLGDSEVQMFVFQYTGQNVTNLYNGDVQYKISPDLKNKKEDMVSGEFVMRSNLIENRTVESYITFTGLNETSKQNYDALLSYAFADGNFQAPHKDLFLTQNTSMIDNGFLMLTWTISENTVTNGGLLDFVVDMKKYDNIFDRVIIIISDYQTLSSLGYSFPKHFLTIIKSSDQIYIKENRKNIIDCSAMGRPVPTLSILERKSNGDLVPTDYPSLVLQKAFSAYGVSVIMNATEGHDMTFVCVARSGTAKKEFTRKAIVGTTSKISHVNLTRYGEVRIIHLTVTVHNPEATSLSCYENQMNGPSIWDRYDVYTMDENIKTNTTLEYTITADFTDVVNPPRTMVCVTYSPWGTNVKTIKLN